MTTLSNDNATSASEGQSSNRAALSELYDKYMGEDSPVPETEEVDTPDVPETSEAQEEAPEVETEETVDDETKPEEEERPVVQAPASWKADMREKFAELSPEIREYILQRENEVGVKYREYAQDRHVAQNFKQVLNPHLPMMQDLGISNPYIAVQNLLQTAKQLYTGTPRERAEKLSELAIEHDIDMTDLANALTERFSQPQQSRFEKEMLERLDRIERSRTQAAPEQNAGPDQESVNSFREEIRAFAKKNEFFHDVEEDMKMLVSMGKASSLQEAYDKAVRMSDSVQKVIADRKVKDQQRATAGTVSVKGSAPKAKPAAKMSRRETLSKLYDEYMGE